MKELDCTWQGCRDDGDAGFFSGAGLDRRTGGTDFCAGERGRPVCVARAGQDAARAAGIDADGCDARDSFRADADLSEVAPEEAPQESGQKAGLSRRPPPSACGIRRNQGAPGQNLSRLRRVAEPLPRNPRTLYRRHSRRSQADGHPARDPSRLVSGLQKARRRKSPRRAAPTATRPPHPGVLGLAALCAGQHALADSRDLQPPPAAETDRQRAALHVAPAGRGVAAAVRTDSRRGVGVGGVARRRQRLAGQWKNTRVVVFLHTRPDVLPDRPVARLSGAEKNLLPRIRGNSGQRFLGRVQRVYGFGCARLRVRLRRSAWRICCAN